MHGLRARGDVERHRPEGCEGAARQGRRRRLRSGAPASLDETPTSFTVTTNHSESFTLTGIADSEAGSESVYLLCGGKSAVSIGQGMMTATQVTSRTDQTPTG